jgi:hypothetical protein
MKTPGIGDNPAVNSGLFFAPPAMSDSCERTAPE